MYTILTVGSTGHLEVYKDDVLIAEFYGINATLYAEEFVSNCEYEGI